MNNSITDSPIRKKKKHALHHNFLQTRKNYEIHSRFVNTLPQAPIRPLRSILSPETGSFAGFPFRKQSMSPGCCHYQTTDQQLGERFVPQTRQQIQPPHPGHNNLSARGRETGGMPMT